jgi:hypothetical protein
MIITKIILRNIRKIINKTLNSMIKLMVQCNKENSDSQKMNNIIRLQRIMTNPNRRLNIVIKLKIDNKLKISSMKRLKNKNHLQ